MYGTAAAASSYSRSHALSCSARQGWAPDAAGDDTWERSSPDDLWREDEDLRKAVRPVLADVGETAQFLAVKGLTLQHEAQAGFLDWLHGDLSAAFRKLIRAAQGDYSDDRYAKRFPKFEGVDKGETPQGLFDAWVGERNPAPSTIESWRYVFAAMNTHFNARSAASITPDDIGGRVVSHLIVKPFKRLHVDPSLPGKIKELLITPSIYLNGKQILTIDVRLIAPPGI
jgi:hypothetical protein